MTGVGAGFTLPAPARAARDLAGIGANPVDALSALDQLIIDRRHTPSPEIARFTAVAGGVQRQRHLDSASDRDEITRSTALATLIAVDGSIAEALTEAGLRVTDFLTVIGIRSVPDTAEVPDARLDPIFATAVRHYLTSKGGRVVTLTDLALAILQSSRAAGDGRLPDRLEKLGLDYERAISTLERQIEDAYFAEAEPSSGFEAEVESEAESRAAGEAPDSTTEAAPDRAPETSERTRWTTDGAATDDLLGRRFLAQVLASRLRGLSGSHTGSFLVHIDGPWGSGKSSLLQFLETELAPSFLLVNVNAWREQQVGVQWWTLHNALRAAIQADSRHRIWARVRSRIDAIRTRLMPFVAVLVLILLAVALALLARLDLTTGSALADALGKILSLGALAVAGLTAVYRLLMPESRLSAEAFVAKSANPMGQVQLLFSRTLRRTRKSVVFLIDDLDRCDEKYIIDFLEVVQTLVREAPVRRHTPGRRDRRHEPPAGPYAFIAADGQWIRSSYESHFDSVKITTVPGRPLGYLFLEKIFQLQVRLPSITEDAKRAYLDSLLTGATAQRPSAAQQALATELTAEVNRATTGPQIDRAAAKADGLISAESRMQVRGAAAVKLSNPVLQAGARHELSRYWKLLEPNPRSIKLVVHTYGTLQSLRTLEGIPVQRTPLALWTIVEIRWPQLADHLRAHPDDIENRAGTPEPAATLLASPEVQAVIASPVWGPLTPDQVRDCTGFRVGASPDTIPDSRTDTD
ncbi:P-loop NTPase fold protein [Cryobacterium frigoriphilum]|uniref:P-loop NTPase fold protein n=1 Tax=Cryobacterium frigoriphilum TaxID=1259150 RepID=UPI00141BBC08|nr:P-loop NTPase fold protein [Cryobacterium frigoriphilum]